MALKCSHASDILQGKNPVDDLMRAGLISGFEGKTCSDINQWWQKTLYRRTKENLSVK